MPRTVVSGAAGFLPSYVVEMLLADGHEIIGLDNFCTGRPENVAHLANEPRFDLVEHDVCEPYDVAGDVDFVLHLASPASPPEFLKMPIAIMKAGSAATHTLLEFAREKGARFLLASTSEIYGDPDVHPQSETYWGRVNPNGVRSVYDEAKRYAEAATMAYHRHHGLETRIIRIFNTYGPRMQPHDGRVVTNFVSQALRGDPLTVYGDGSQTRSFGFVTDTADGLVRILHSDEPTPFNIGNPNEFTVLELAHKVLELTDSSSEVSFKPFVTADDPKQRCPDISKAKTVLGWEPRVQLDEGLPKTIEYLRGEIEART